MENTTKKIAILGIRGLPANHGGFETFAEYLSLELVQRGWEVTVYCQTEGGEFNLKKWNNIQLIEIPVFKDNSLGSIFFDIKSTFHACRNESLVLTLGYNTGFLSILCRLFKLKNIINMDGIEWQREKWNKLIKIWFFLNERIACHFSTHLIADHPEIKKHLSSRVHRDKITMIPYGSEDVSQADESILSSFSIKANHYMVVIARPEPENSILEIVRAFSIKDRGIKLVILGNFTPKDNPYHNKVMKCASSEVLFVGSIYEKQIVQALRLYSLAYIHGHKVGGTNPSLVESIGSGSLIIAKDNQFNRWVTDNQMLYFDSECDIDHLIDSVITDEALVSKKRVISKKLFQQRYRWNTIIDQYESLLARYIK